MHYVSFFGYRSFLIKLRADGSCRVEGLGGFDTLAAAVYSCNRAEGGRR